MNRIFIHDLRVEARIGVYDWERHLPQTVRLDVELAAPSELPFQSGRIADALDYAKIVERLKAFAKDNPPRVRPVSFAAPAIGVDEAVDASPYELRSVGERPMRRE